MAYLPRTPHTPGRGAEALASRTDSFGRIQSIWTCCSCGFGPTRRDPILRCQGCCLDTGNRFNHRDNNAFNETPDAIQYAKYLNSELDRSPLLWNPPDISTIALHRSSDEGEIDLGRELGVDNFFSSESIGKWPSSETATRIRMMSAQVVAYCERETSLEDGLNPKCTPLADLGTPDISSCWNSHTVSSQLFGDLWSISDSTGHHQSALSDARRKPPDLTTYILTFFGDCIVTALSMELFKLAEQIATMIQLQINCQHARVIEPPLFEVYPRLSDPPVETTGRLQVPET